MISVINLKNKMSEINGKHCSPFDVALVNDQVVRMSYVDGDFTGIKTLIKMSLFFILKGKLVI